VYVDVMDAIADSKNTISQLLHNLKEMPRCMRYYNLSNVSMGRNSIGLYHIQAIGISSKITSFLS
jgi:hypothetical protein